MKKFKDQSIWDIVKLMFHGSSGTDPKLIYGSEYGLDNRYSSDGCMYGRGIYLANNSKYSLSY